MWPALVVVKDLGSGIYLEVLIIYVLTQLKWVQLLATSET